METYKRLAIFAATALLALPAVPAQAGPTSPSCAPGSEVGMEDFIVWVDVPGGGVNADVPVWAANACGTTRTITYRTYDITARAGEDYVGVNSGTVVLPAGTKNTKIRIQILAKTAAAPDETFGIRLLSGAKFVDPEAVVTIKSR